MRDTGLKLLAITTLTTTLWSQQSPLRTAGWFDDKNAPSAAPIPGLRGGFRQQILVSQSRLAGLSTRSITELSFRRDLGSDRRMQGGLVDFRIRLGTSPTPPERAKETFSSNHGQLSTVFQGRITIPTSPQLGPSPVPWSPQNSFGIPLQSQYTYQSGTLCIDIEGRPVPNNEPLFWYVDNELDGARGKVETLGTSCSQFSSKAKRSHYANRTLLQLGSTMQLTLFGRPNSSPLMLLGTNALAGGGIDLSIMGATGCYQYIDYFALLPLAYRSAPGNLNRGIGNFEIQLPDNPAMSGVFFYTQVAEIETALSKPWSNPAGLTTSNALKLTVATQGPTLGMSTVTSHAVDNATQLPGRGRVDMETAPVLRIAFQ